MTDSEPRPDEDEPAEAPEGVASPSTEGEREPTHAEVAAGAVSDDEVSAETAPDDEVAAKTASDDETSEPDGSGADETESRKPEWKPPPPERLEGAIEALLLVSGDVVRVERLRDLLGLQSVVPVREAIARIQVRWAEAGLAFEVEQVGGGVRVVTRPEYAEYVGRLTRRPASDKLSRAQLETLCIVAYKQPVGRAEVERIRGVQAGEPLRALLERRLLKIAGRSDQPGRPLLYGTTQLFLTAFGLNDLKDLPAPKDLQRL